MRIIQPSYEILSCPEHSLEDIERAARTCYKSEEKITPGSAERLVRHLLDRGHHAMIEFGGAVTVKFVSNRGFTHEMVRHRLGSFAQESTRYCNYGKGKFGSEITVCAPDAVLHTWTDDPTLWCPARDEMLSLWQHAQCTYLDLLKKGVPPELAREVLPIGLKAEIVVQANVREWRHIFGQRCSKKAHPRMRELMVPLLEELQSKVPVIFEGVSS